MKIVKIINENSEYQFSQYKIDEIWTVSFEFNDRLIGFKEHGNLKSHATAIKKTDCIIFELK